MQRIIPHFWFDNQAEDAVRLYTGLFKNANIGRTTRYTKAGQEFHGQDEGAVTTVEFELDGQSFMALNGGPHFKFTPAISFFVTLESEAEVDALWDKLSEGGSALMPLQPYPWSEKYGWLTDRYGLSWQVNLGEQGEVGQTIVPSLLFVGEQHGKAEEAISFYTSLFGGSSITSILHYDAGEHEPEGTVKHAQFTLAGQTFMAMESALQHDFTFNEALSFIVNCDTQAEVDRFWNALSAVPEAEQCGWLKDRFGVSWQIVPTALPKLLSDPDPTKAQRVMEAMLQMKKLDIATLQQA
jgi:predicted 3-demethylubiquinone-9 3-methyltransferase (glyoxalase superfamily)